MINCKKLLLASNSPRRRELLKGLDIPVELIQPRDIDESYPPALQGGDICQYVAREKMRAYDDLTLGDGEVLVTADTIVWLPEVGCLGKPHSREEAISMLTALSGKKHTVYTGVCLRSLHEEKSFVGATDVYFDPLTHEEITYYVDRYEPYDKAGAYGIQEWIGNVGISAIEGSYFNVVGLPVQRLYRALREMR